MTASGVRPRRPYTARVPLAQRREQLLDAALQIIDRDGYGAVSIDAIARELNVTRPVVYHAFSGLDELLNELLDRQEGRALDQLMRTISLPPDLSRATTYYVRHTIAALIAMVQADPATWKPILLSSAETPLVVRERVERDRELVRQRFQTLVAAVQLVPEARRHIDPAIAAHALVALAEYFGRLLLTRPDAVDPEALATTIAGLLS